MITQESCQDINNIMMKHFKVDGNQITFTDSRFYLDVDSGTFCPSVSTILEAFPKGPEFYKWLKEQGEGADDIKEAAGAQGSNVHKMTEDYDKGLLVSLLNPANNTQTWTLKEWAMFSRYVEFRQQVSNMKILAIEMQVCDIELAEAGTLDRLVEIGGKTLLLDIKTSNNVYPSYWLQLAAYRRMLERKAETVKIDAVGIVWLNARTRGTQPKKIQGNGWQLLVREDSTEDLELYECTKKLWLVQNKDLLPKETTYQLTYKL